MPRPHAVSSRPMHILAAGFWGAFFATAGLMLAASLAAFARSHRRVALTAALSAVVSAAFVLAYLGWLPLDGAAEARFLAHLAVVVATMLALMLMELLGLLRSRLTARRVVAGLVAFDAAVLAAGWALPAWWALFAGSAAAFLLGAAMWCVALRSALRGDRLAWSTVSGVGFMLAALAGLSWIALDRGVPWPVHAASAFAGMAYLTVMAAALWVRYAYLLELAEVMAHGPSYDPVTRMRSHTETGQLVGETFIRREGEPRAIGVIAICISNLYALENLHGRAAFNHALFICAGRLRRCATESVEMGRLGDDGFLLLARQMHDLGDLAGLARQIRDQLCRPVSLSTSPDPARIDAAGTAWMADIGIGVMSTTTAVRPSQAVAAVRAMARTGWSYGSRLAFYDDSQGRIAELPAHSAPAPVA
jgi:GGDEF domain-containing protein